MIYAIIALIAWNILVTYRLWKLYATVNSIDYGCKSMFTSLVKAVNIHTNILNNFIDDPEPTSKRVH